MEYNRQPLLYKRKNHNAECKIPILKVINLNTSVEVDLKTSKMDNLRVTASKGKGIWSQETGSFIKRGEK